MQHPAPAGGQEELWEWVSLTDIRHVYITHWQRLRCTSTECPARQFIFLYFWYWGSNLGPCAYWAIDQVLHTWATPSTRMSLPLIRACSLNANTTAQKGADVLKGSHLTRPCPPWDSCSWASGIPVRPREGKARPLTQLATPAAPRTGATGPWGEHAQH